ncbi:MAG: esterase-like activity of phytase family protein [Spirochaetota bacterium]
MDRIRASALLLSMLAAVALSPPILAAGPEPSSHIVITCHAVPLDPSNASLSTVGRLRFVSGLALNSRDRNFGGWSDLWVGASGGELIALSDRAHWLRCRIMMDGAGSLMGLADAEIIPMLDPKGRPLIPPRSDAESMVSTAEGRILSFEGRHRLVLYPGEWPFTLESREIPAPPGLSSAPDNQGIEASVALADGSLVFFTEGLKAEGGLRAWIRRSVGDYLPLVYVPAPGFAPTAATRLPSGDILVLERRLSILEGWQARIVRVEAGAFDGGARIVGEELALISSPLTVDNFEGISAMASPDGQGTLIYILSDDNFMFFERTLLLQFSYEG